MVESYILDLPRRPENTVAPAKAGAHYVCLGRPTGVIGPSLRWGDDRSYDDISVIAEIGVDPTPSPPWLVILKTWACMARS